jgi:hypothetical protein
LNGWRHDPLDIPDAPGYILSVKDRIFSAFRGTVACAAAVSAAAFLFFGCSAEDRFSEYHGVNLISGYTLDMWVPDHNEVAAPAPAQTDGIYMRYEFAGAEGPGGAEAYLLRTNNLMPNGDFEETDAGSQPAGWTSSGASAVYSVTDGARTIAGKALQFDIGDNPSIIFFPLGDLPGLTDGFRPATYYTFRFAVKSENRPTLAFEINENPDNIDIRNTIVLTFPEDKTISSIFPDHFEGDKLDNLAIRESDSDTVAFYINIISQDEAKGIQKGSIDNLRFVRSDLVYNIRLRLRREDAGRLPLPSGTYRLSVYVKQDPAAGTDNFFPASRIALGINRNWDATSGSFLDNSYEGIPADAAWADWTQVSATFRNVQIDPPATNEDYNIELTISATDSKNNFTRDAGSILVSLPSLEFIPD